MADVTKPRVFLADDHALLLGALETVLSHECDVVGKASEIRAPLEAAFGPVTVVTPDACDTLDRK